VVRVVEQGTGRTLVDVKQESDSRKQAGVQSGGPSLVRRESAPADLKKDAGGFDLPIALGLLLGSGQVAFDRVGSFAIVCEMTQIPGRPEASQGAFFAGKLPSNSGSGGVATGQCLQQSNQ
jgi:magnesium chelatase family protein